MPEQEISPQAQMAVAAAFGFAGPVGSSPGGWRVRFQEGLMRAAAAMNGHPAQEAQSMIDADVFAGEYGGYDLEETSTRLLVKIKSDTGRDKGKDADGYERIRTDRTDSAFGKRMKERLDDVPVGSRIVIWKVLERMKNSEDDAKVRVLKHFEVLQINKDSTSRPSPSGSPSGTGGGAVRPPAPPPTDEGWKAASNSVPPSPEWQIVLDRIHDLSNKAKVEFVTQCRKEQLVWMNPVEADEERIKKILTEKEKL